MATDNDTEQCPIGHCEKDLGDGHWFADPGSHTPHAYHTDKIGLARQWKYRDGMDVSPDPGEYPEGTLGYYRYIDTEAEQA